MKISTDQNSLEFNGENHKFIDDKVFKVSGCKMCSLSSTDACFTAPCDEVLRTDDKIGHFELDTKGAEISN